MRKDYIIIIIFSVILCTIYCNETYGQLSTDTETSSDNWTISLAQTESTYKSAKIKLLEEDKSSLIVERKLAVGRYNNAEEFKKAHYYNIHELDENDMEIEVFGNGWYTAYATDRNGFEAVDQIEISSIETQNGNSVTVAQDITAPANKVSIFVKVNKGYAMNMQYVNCKLDSVESFNKYVNKKNFNNSFTVNENGWYTVKVNFRNESIIYPIHIGNIEDASRDIDEIERNGQGLLNPVIDILDTSINNKVSTEIYTANNCIITTKLFFNGFFTIEYCRSNTNKGKPFIESFDAINTGWYSIYVTDINMEECISYIYIS